MVIIVDSDHTALSGSRVLFNCSALTVPVPRNWVVDRRYQTLLVSNRYI